MAQLHVLSYNILKGGVGREEHLATVIASAHADIVVFQEATHPAVIERLAQATQMTTWAATRGRSLAFMSRVPIAAHHWVRPRWSQHAFLEIVPEGLDVRIFGVHLSAVHAAWTEARRVRELRSLLAAIKEHDRSHHLLVGDFNTLAPGERLPVNKLPYRLRLLVWLSGGRIRWQTIAIMLGAGYADGFREKNGAELGLTFPTWDPQTRLDYVFVPKSFLDRLAACEVIANGPAVPLASDHFPIKASVEWS
jgi:endonuclease/exonuclease/phosphatase family metal-dependent hydrolase